MRTFSTMVSRKIGSLSIAGAATAVTLCSLATPAFAQDNGSPAAAPAAAQAPAASAPTASPAPLLQAPAATNTDREETTTVAGGYSCTLENTGALPDDALTASDVICHALATHHATPGHYEIRIGKLGGKLLLVVSDRDTQAERRLFIQGIDEVPQAADRLASALAENKTVEQSESTENIVNPETTAPKQKAIQGGAYMGLTGMTAAGTSASPSGGLALGLDFRLKRFSLTAEGRAGGIGSSDDKLGYASIGMGGRYFFSDDDIAPFLGAGAEFAYFQANHANGEADGSGFAAVAEVGLGIFRTSHVSGIIGLRADLPLFDLKDGDSDFSGISGSTTHYVVPLSLNLGLLFH